MTDKRRSPNRCPSCGAEMEAHRENTPYRSLEGVTLVDAHVLRCKSCGNTGVEVAHAEDLDRAVALAVARRREKLGPKEVRFLRKYLGLSATELAEQFGAERDTVYRWEREDAPQAMNDQAERLLRVLVLSDKPVEAYSLRDLASRAPAPTRLRAELGKAGWSVQAP